MTSPTLDTIAAAKARLAEELRQLEQQEVQLRKDQTSDAFTQVISLLHLFGQNFDSKQKAEIAGHVISGARPAKKNTRVKEDLPPKYWLPHTQEKWSGRGRPPRSFKTWEGTVSHREWKAKHPEEKYPKYPG